MLNIAVFGATGRMGGAVTRVVTASGKAVVSGACTEAGHPDIGRDVGELAGCGTLGVSILDDAERALASAHVAIDFTLPVAVEANLAACQAVGCGLVMGTTGLGAIEMAMIEKASSSIPILYGRNMSIGVNVFTELARQAAQYLGPDWETEITESHHRHKVDAPSGTALQLGEAIANERGQKLADVAVYGRSGQTGARTADEIGFSSIRAGSIVGEHTVSFITDEETVELKHIARNRDVFAAGALRAASWLNGQPPGLYSMRDVLGFA